MRAIGLETLCGIHLEAQAWGTPDDVIDKLRARRRLVGDFDLNCCFRFSGLSVEEAERSMRTFAEAVMPVVRPRTVFA